jgi:hypothetical protein
VIEVILYAVIGRSDTAIKNRWRSLKRFPLSKIGYSQDYVDSHSLTWCSSLAASDRETIAGCSTSIQQIGDSTSGMSADIVINCQVKGNVKQQ